MMIRSNSSSVQFSTALDKFSLEDVVRIIRGQPEEEIPDFHGKLGAERADDIVEAGLLGGDTSGLELRFELSKPNFRVGWPEGWKLDADGSGTEAGRPAADGSATGASVSDILSPAVSV